MVSFRISRYVTLSRRARPIQETTPDRSRWRSSSISVCCGPRPFGSRSGRECCLGSTTDGPVCMAAASKPVLWTSHSGSGAVCRSDADGIHMWQFERSRPEGRARATRRQWHRRGTHWVEHGVRHGCMSCARGQLWRDEAACGRQQLVCRAGGAEQTLAAKDAADERTFQGGDRHPGPRFSA